MRLLENKELFTTKKEFRDAFNDFMKPRGNKIGYKKKSTWYLSLKRTPKDSFGFIPFLNERDHLGRMLNKSPDNKS